MLTKQAVGQGASAFKYDILTALLTLAAQDQGPQSRLALRLSLVITARYNWRSGRFVVGQRELAQMWGVTERTAKREMAQMKALGWIKIVRQAARGRVAEHQIVMDTVLQATMPHWACVGSDFVARMSGAGDAQTSNVVPLIPRAAPQNDGSVWAKASAWLYAQDATTHGAWFGALQQLEQIETTLYLAAPSAFVANYVETHFGTRLLLAAVQVDPSIRVVRVKMV